MSYVGDPFRHDIFVSYSHGDVAADGELRLKQWSQGFAQELEKELQAFADIGGQIRVFLDADRRPDHGVDPLAPLSDKLKQEVAGSAILAVLMSDHYIGSSWCQRERIGWIEAQQAHKFAHENRIAVAKSMANSEAVACGSGRSGRQRVLRCVFL